MGIERSMQVVRGGAHALRSSMHRFPDLPARSSRIQVDFPHAQMPIRYVGAGSSSRSAMTRSSTVEERSVPSAWASRAASWCLHCSEKHDGLCQIVSLDQPMLSERELQASAQPPSSIHIEHSPSSHQLGQPTRRRSCFVNTSNWKA